MSLKNKLNKMKSFLFDEEEESEVKKLKPKEKKVISKKSENKELIRKEPEKDIEELYFEDTNIDLKTDDIVKSRVVKNEKEFKFPDFTDDDFMLKKEEKKSELPKPEKINKTNLYQGSKRKEETKKFKPSPIISPIYGLLDKDGNTIKSDSEVSGSSFKSNEEVTFDDVRKKAYGILEEELSNTLKRLSTKTIEEAEEEMKEKEKKLSNDKETLNDNDDMILPNVSFKEIDIDKQVSSNLKNKVIDDDDDDDTKEQDLFKLIDTMYDKEGKDE